MKKLFLALVLLASPAWAQYYPSDNGAAAAVQISNDYKQQNQNWQLQQQADQQQQQIDQMQQQQPYTQYVPVYGDGTQPTQ